MLRILPALLLLFASTATAGLVPAVSDEPAPLASVLPSPLCAELAELVRDIPFAVETCVSGVTSGQALHAWLLAAIEVCRQAFADPSTDFAQGRMAACTEFTTASGQETYLGFLRHRQEEPLPDLPDDTDPDHLLEWLSRVVFDSLGIPPPGVWPPGEVTWMDALPDTVGCAGESSETKAAVAVPSSPGGAGPGAAAAWWIVESLTPWGVLSSGGMQPPHTFQWAYECSGTGQIWAEGGGGLARRVIIREAGAECEYDGILKPDCATPPAPAAAAYSAGDSGTSTGYPCNPDTLGYFREICWKAPVNAKVCANPVIRGVNEPWTTLHVVGPGSTSKFLQDFGQHCTQYNVPISWSVGSTPVDPDGVVGLVAECTEGTAASQAVVGLLNDGSYAYTSDDACQPATNCLQENPGNACESAYECRDNTTSCGPAGEDGPITMTDLECDGDEGDSALCSFAQDCPALEPGTPCGDAYASANAAMALVAACVSQFFAPASIDLRIPSPLSAAAVDCSMAAGLIEECMSGENPTCRALRDLALNCLSEAQAGGPSACGTLYHVLFVVREMVAECAKGEDPEGVRGCSEAHECLSDPVACSGGEDYLRQTCGGETVSACTERAKHLQKQAVAAVFALVQNLCGSTDEQECANVALGIVETTIESLVVFSPCGDGRLPPFEAAEDMEWPSAVESCVALVVSLTVSIVGTMMGACDGASAKDNECVNKVVRRVRFVMVLLNGLNINPYDETDLGDVNVHGSVIQADMPETIEKPNSKSLLQRLKDLLTPTF